MASILIDEETQSVEVLEGRVEGKLFNNIFFPIGSMTTRIYAPRARLTILCA